MKIINGFELGLMKVNLRGFIILFFDLMLTYAGETHNWCYIVTSEIDYVNQRNTVSAPAPVSLVSTYVNGADYREQIVCDTKWCCMGDKRLQP